MESIFGPVPINILLMKTGPVLILFPMLFLM